MGTEIMSIEQIATETVEIQELFKIAWDDYVKTLPMDNTKDKRDIAEVFFYLVAGEGIKQSAAHFKNFLKQ